ncbi:MAG: SCO family protein [Candidatus Krumholzibacteriia bacterium]
MMSRPIPLRSGGGPSHRAGILPGLVAAVLAICVLSSGVAAGAAADAPRAERGEPLPDALAEVGVSEKFDARVPGDIVMRDETGAEVRLDDVFGRGRPVILNLMYLGCPMLCGLISQGMIDAMRQMDWTAGEEFTVLSVSFDHTETPQVARASKEKLVRDLGRPGAASGWHFLTGDEDQIRRLTDAVGFSFAWNEQRQEFAHAAVLVVLTPDGRVARYLYGVQFDPKTLRLSLVEAADGKIGTAGDRIMLFCFNYDASTGRYSPAARNLMKAGGLLTVAIVAILIVAFRWQERRRHVKRGAQV